MKTYMPALGVLIVASITIVSGGIHGEMTERWGAEIDRETIAAQLDTIPEIVGDWELVASEPIADSALKQLECAGYISRAYHNSETGERVTVTIILGPPGPISVHLPEICHSGRGVAPTGKREHVTIETKRPKSAGAESSVSTKEKLWAVNFEAKGLDGYRERFFYAWGTGGAWVAPEEPRVSFGAYPYLYKIQAASKLARDADLSARDPVEEFLKVFLPAAQVGLVPYVKK
ncbi:MAG: exosortase-associated EpsI family protein [Candidatus Nealsonbacteria bacterium]|nr:exosortase-associated EpsI family protein [Candidatus Nealsonbacteria bacterium]